MSCHACEEQGFFYGRHARCELVAEKAAHNLSRDAIEALVAENNGIRAERDALKAALERAKHELLSDPDNETAAALRTIDESLAKLAEKGGVK